MREKKDVKLYSYQDTFSSMLLIVGVIVIIQYKQLETCSLQLFLGCTRA